MADSVACRHCRVGVDPKQAQSLIDAVQHSARSVVFAVFMRVAERRCFGGVFNLED
jgi:hypothetical protein